ncbi:unnamed protein product [Gongylonema pulchrum]|uniref:Uncharacterized protein n=1 Tax=Gongylonema pulchrum TaxID=637853 RepID=A0A3P6RAA3_9BILA|nr:unnamed protein product [Gongylonema pulchrum]
MQHRVPSTTEDAPSSRPSCPLCRSRPQHTPFALPAISFQQSIAQKKRPHVWSCPTQLIDIVDKIGGKQWAWLDWRMRSSLTINIWSCAVTRCDCVLCVLR